jgi:hypothetical protein
MWNVWGKGDVHTGFWWGDLMEKYHLEDPNVDGKITLKLVLQEVEWGSVD